MFMLFNMIGFIVGVIYFFVVDGFDDDVCDFIVNVIFGSIIVLLVLGIFNIVFIMLFLYCLGSIVIFIVNGV